MDFVIPEKQDYPSILKFMVEGEKPHRITDLEMIHIESIWKLVFNKILEKNDTQTLFNDEIMNSVENEYSDYTYQEKIVQSRRMNLPYIIEYMMEFYEELKISYKRSGRLEIINKAIKKYEQQQMQPEHTGAGINEKAE